MTDTERIAHLEAELEREREEKATLYRLIELALSHDGKSYVAPRFPVENITLFEPKYHGEGEHPSIKIRLLTPEEREAKKAERAIASEEVGAHIRASYERVRGKTHVYFIQQGDSGAIKIGCSKNPSQRLQGLQTGHSEPLRLLTCAVGSQAQERALHDRFAHLRVSGEWFRPADDLLSYIRLVADRRAL